MGGSLALLQRPEGRMDCVLRQAAVSLQVRQEGGLNSQMVQSTSGKDRKRLICLASPGLLADGPASHVGGTGGDGHEARALLRCQ